jgi:hypothetical protein
MTITRCSAHELEFRLARIDEAVDLLSLALSSDDRDLRFLVALAALSQRARVALIAERTSDYARLASQLDEALEQTLSILADGATPRVSQRLTLLPEDDPATLFERMAASTKPPPPRFVEPPAARRSLRPASGVRPKVTSDTLPVAGSAVARGRSGLR